MWTLVPLGTSVWVVWDHSGLSVWLWTCDKWPHCFSISSTYLTFRIRSVSSHAYLNCTQKHIFTHRFTWMHTHTHKCARLQIEACSHAHTHATQRTCHVSWRQGSDTVWCVRELYRLGKRTKDLTEAARGPTITAWNITAVKEPWLWQEESWAPASDSTDQNLLLCGHRDGLER